jgi:hypothetical protein
LTDLALDSVSKITLLSLDLGNVSDILMLQQILNSPDLRACRKLWVKGHSETYDASENVW